MTTDSREFQVFTDLVDFSAYRAGERARVTAKEFVRVLPPSSCENREASIAITNLKCLFAVFVQFSRCGCKRLLHPFPVKEKVAGSTPEPPGADHVYTCV